MLKKTVAALSAFLLLISTTTNGMVYRSSSSNSIYNGDGIAESFSVVSNPVGGNFTFEKITIEGATSFNGAIYDGDRIWLVPSSGTYITAISQKGEAENIPFPDSFTQVDNAFFGGAFDGEYIYLTPYHAAGIMKISKTSKTAEYITSWPDGFDKTSVLFKGAVFDGERVWLIPSTGNKIASVNSSNQINVYNIEFNSIQDAFCGGIFANEAIYFVPNKADDIVKFDISSGTSSVITGGGKISNMSFEGGFYEGQHIYFVPANNSGMARINTESDEIEVLNLPEGVTGGFSGGAFDGRFIWLAPKSGSAIIKYDIYNKLFESIEIPSYNGENYSGGAFDGENIWFASSNGFGALKISGDNTPPTAMNIYLNTVPSVAVSGEMVAQDPDIGDVITFSIVSNPSMGVVDLDPSTGAFTYTPSTSDTGTDTFTYKANDGKNDSNNALVTITIAEGEDGEGTVPTGGIYIDLWGHWAEESANALTNKNIFLGEKVGDYYYFYPDYLLTRAGFLVLANSVFGFEGSMTDTTLPFADINDAPEWILMAASAAYHGGMISGSLDNGILKLLPNEKITRLEAFTTINNVIGVSDADISIGYKDANLLPDWSLPTIRSLMSIGMLQGYDDGTIRPNNTVSRAEAIKMLYAALLYLENSGRDPNALK